MNRGTRTTLFIICWLLLTIMACTEAFNIDPGTAVIGVVEIKYLGWTCHPDGLVEFYAVRIGNIGERGRFMDAWLSPIPCENLANYQSK